MGNTPGGCRDLRKFQEDNSTFDAFSKLVSGGKAYYKTVIEKKAEEKRCAQCKVKLEGNEKFCPECGTKTEWQLAAEKPKVLLSSEELEKMFKEGKMKEHEILAYMRDELKVPDNTAFELINKWRKDIQTKQEPPKIDLNQFKG
jgi:uncharacterized OB-fold protein